MIATTNTTWSQTKAMVSRIVNEFGGPLGGGTMRAFPTPQAIAGVPIDEFAVSAKMGYRNASVHGLATDIAEGRVDLESWQDEPLTAVELAKRVTGLRGVGPYATACLMLYLGKPARVAVDSWARTQVGRELGRVVSDKEVYARFADFGDWAGLAYYF